MDKYANIKNFAKPKFKAVTGVSPSTFEAMVEVLRTAYAAAHNKGGRHRALTVENMLLLTLEYIYEYRTQECIGATYGLHKTNVGEVIKWVENVLITSGLFDLPGKKALVDPVTEIEVIVVDTSETPIQRPTHRQRRYYSGKKNSIQ